MTNNFFIVNTIYVKKLLKENYIFILFLFTFMLLSFTTIYSATLIMPKMYNGYHIKQLIFYMLAFLLFVLLRILNNNKIFKYINYIYIANLILLVLVLFIGNEINGTKAWLDTPLFSFQPSEMIKISLTLLLCKEIYFYDFKSLKNYKADIIFSLKLFLLTLIPSILVFIEPDTGNIISYVIIFVTSLLLSKINVKLKISYVFLGVFLFILAFLFYKYYSDVIIKLFGNDIYYRINRLLDWQKSSGMQLENSLISIGSASLFGKGFLNTPLYFPEPYTDFIFTVFVSNYGFIGCTLFIILIVIFLLVMLENAKKIKHGFEKNLIICFFIIFILSYIQNISMTFGLLPITGITLPFISYGGSSLIVYTIILSILNNIKNTSHL